MFSSLYVKLGIAVVAILAILGSYLWVYSKGKSVERAAWEKQKAIDIALALEEKARIEKENAIAIQTVVANHERQRNEIQDNLDSARSELGRMRLKVRPCADKTRTPPAPAGSNDSAGTGRRDEGGSVDFTPIGERILSLGAARDSCAAQVEGLQAYILAVTRRDLEKVGEDGR